MILLDTNILIEVFKGNERIKEYLKDINKLFCISSITQMELYYGAFNKQEIIKLDKFLELFYVFHLTPSISKKAVELIKTYSKSHNLTLPDSLIAATALDKDIPLFTLNLKDFRYIENLKLIKMR